MHSLNNNDDLQISESLTMWKKVLCSECIFWQRNVSADCPVIERKDLALVLELVVATLSLETEKCASHAFKSKKRSAIHFNQKAYEH